MGLGLCAILVMAAIGILVVAALLDTSEVDLVAFGLALLAGALLVGDLGLDRRWPGADRWLVRSLLTARYLAWDFASRRDRYPRSGLVQRGARTDGDRRRPGWEAPVIADETRERAEEKRDHQRLHEHLAWPRQLPLDLGGTRATSRHLCRAEQGPVGGEEHEVVPLVVELEVVVPRLIPA